MFKIEHSKRLMPLTASLYPYCTTVSPDARVSTTVTVSRTAYSHQDTTRGSPTPVSLKNHQRHAGIKKPHNFGHIGGYDTWRYKVGFGVFVPDRHQNTARTFDMVFELLWKAYITPIMSENRYQFTPTKSEYVPVMHGPPCFNVDTIQLHTRTSGYYRCQSGLNLGIQFL